MAAVESVEGAVQYKYTEFDLRYVTSMQYWRDRLHSVIRSYKKLYVITRVSLNKQFCFV